MNERNLITANAHRSAAACRRDTARTAAWRAAMPDSTLAEIAAAIGDSKDAYSARLRRAYARAGVA